MNVDERKSVTEAWLKAAKNTKQHVMVQIGGTNLPDVLELVGYWNLLRFCGKKNNTIVYFRHNMQKRMGLIRCFVCPNYTTNRLRTRSWLIIWKSLVGQLPTPPCFCITYRVLLMLIVGVLYVIVSIFFTKKFF